MSTKTHKLKIDGVDIAIKDVSALKDQLSKLEAEFAGAKAGTAHFQDLQRQIIATKEKLELAEKGIGNLNSTKLDKLKGTLSSLKSGIGSVSENFLGATSATEMLTKATEKLGIENEYLTKAINMFGGAAEGSFGKAGKGATLFGRVTKMALASTGIGLLVVALMSVVTYFTKSTEGSEKLGSKMAYLKGVFTGITDVLAVMGKAIVDAFSNPQTIIDGLTERLKFLGSIVKDVLTGNFTDAWDKASTAASNFAAGVQNVVDQVNKSGEAAQAVFKLERAYKQADLALKQQEGTLNAIIAKNEAIAASDVKSERERNVAAQTALNTKKQLLAMQNEVLKTQLAFVSAENDAEAIGAKTVDMKKAEQEIRNQITANIAEAGKIELEAADAAYARAIDMADKKKDTLELERDRNKQILRDQLEEATTLEGKLAIQKAILDEELKYNKAVTETFGKLADTSDKAGRLLEVGNSLISAQDEYKVAVKATTDEYAKLNAEAEKRSDAADIEDKKLRAAKAGFEKNFELQLDYLEMAEQAELESIEKIHQQEVSRAGITATEKEAADKEYYNKKLSIDLNYAQQKEAIDEAAKTKKEEDLNKELERQQELADAVMDIYDAMGRTLMSVYDTLGQSTADALEARLEGVNSALTDAQSALSDITSQQQEVSSNIQTLEEQLLTVRGAAREKIIKQLEKEEAKEKQLAAERKKEDDRIKKAEQDKLNIEKEKEKAIAKQVIVTQGLAVVQSTLTGLEALAAGLSASKNGKFGWDNIAILVAMTGAIIASTAQIKQASKGFYDGGYTGDGGKYEYAGPVHKGEIVWSQEDIKRFGGKEAVENMRLQKGPGYATGGAVAMSLPSPATSSDPALIAELSAMRAELRANLDKPIYTVATEVAEVNAKVATIKETALAA